MLQTSNYGMKCPFLQNIRTNKDHVYILCTFTFNMVCTHVSPRRNFSNAEVGISNPFWCVRKRLSFRLFPNHLGYKQ